MQWKLWKITQIWINMITSHEQQFLNGGPNESDFL